MDSKVSLAWSLDASMPMFSAMALTTVGPAPTKRPPTPSSLTMELSEWKAFLGRV